MNINEDYTAGFNAYNAGEGMAVTAGKSAAFDEGYWAAHNQAFDDYTCQEPCLDDYLGNCSGVVEYRFPLSGTGKSFPRCDAHWSERLDIQDGINRRYPDSDMAPSDFDPTYAGESWNGDY